MISARAALACLLLASCGDGPWQARCVQSCDRLFAPDGCHLGSSDADRSDAHGRCTAQCESVAGEAGEVRAAYTPTQPDESAETYINRAEAELWMDCVEETPCTELDDGGCPPVF